jgi:UDP-3-O-[3-hydroxymyristoyl] glucosamine N-acyltransferase
MARLIPRKQIEEQQNISGSFRVGEDINIGNNTIISGSIFVSQSFFFGSATSSRNEITGSVFLTGSLVIEGDLRTGAPNTILSVTSSNTVLAVDTQRYAGILAKDFGAN